MRKLMRNSLIVVATLALVVAAAAAAQEAPAEKTPKPVSVYRVDFAIHESENGQRVNTRNYTMLLEAGGDGSIRTGSSVPVPVGEKQFNYVDVGVNLDCKLKERESRVALKIVLEISDIASRQESESLSRTIIRRNRSQVQTAIPPGKPTVVSTVEDAVSKRRYELEVTATKVK